jgi:hypothetical protein
MPQMRAITNFLRFAACAAAALVLSAHAAVGPAPTAQAGAAALRARHAELRESLERNGFGRPVHLASREGPEVLTGDAHAIVNYPFATVSEAMHRASDWCDILIMPFNTKLCTATPANDQLTIYVGRKNDVEPRDAYRLDFSYRIVARTADYLRIELRAPQGPLGTRDYVITLESAPLEGNRSFIHLSYSYAYGTTSRLAMQAYLATIGRNKVGFSEVEREGHAPELVRGMRGIMERNTMRYYLAIEAYLGSLSAPAERRVEKRLSDWYVASSRYPRQLHEMERNAYISMKTREVSRMKGAT